MVTGDISQIISLRIHPHPEPTAEPTFEPTAEPTVFGDDDDALYDGGTYGGMPQPRNERPWEELQNNTDTADDMEGRDAEDEGEDEDGDSDDEDPASDDGGSLLNLLDQVDNGEATKTTTGIFNSIGKSWRELAGTAATTVATTVFGRGRNRVVGRHGSVGSAQELSYFRHGEPELSVLSRRFVGG